MSWSDRKLLEVQGKMWRAEARGVQHSWLYRHFSLWRSVVDRATNYRP